MTSTSSTHTFSSDESITSVAIAGLGLIGGSIAKQLAYYHETHNRSLEVLVWNHSDRMRADATSHGMIWKDSLQELVEAKPQILILAVPIQTLRDVFAEIHSAVSEDTVVVDIASVKILPRELAEEFELSEKYVGTHPMFGMEKTGWENARSKLGVNATWAVCPAMNDTSRMKASFVAKFIRGHLSGRTIFAEAKEHDDAVALTSHLPHVLAFELAGIISEGGDLFAEHGLSKATTELAKQLVAGSFHGVTRVATGNERMFEGMLLENSAPIAKLLREVAGDLGELAQSLESGEVRRKKDVHHFIARSDPFRTASAEEPRKPTHHHKADGWVKCRCGREHWGKNGAAGIFLVRTSTEADGTESVSEVLVQLRALWSAAGGTWGTPGGAIDEGETAQEGALREAWEEANVDPSKVEVLGTIVRDHIDWSYTTVLCRELSGEQIEPAVVDRESIDVKFMAVEELLSANTPKLPAFGEELEELLAKTAELL